MNILVTGAAGFIGSHLAEKLANLGNDVIGVDCLTDFYARELKTRNVDALRERGVFVRFVDLAADDLNELAGVVDVIYHLAAQPGLLPAGEATGYERNNLTATSRLLAAAQRNPRLRAFVNISSSSVYGSIATGSEETTPQPISPYGRTKLAAETMALDAYRRYGLPSMSFRLFSVYGPRDRPDKLFPRAIRAVLSGTSFTMYEGSERHQRSFTFIDDVVDGLLTALELADSCSGEIFNLGSETTLTTLEGLELIEEIVGLPVVIERRPPRPGDQQQTKADMRKAAHVLGFRPSTTLREGLTRTIRWHRAEPQRPRYI